MEEDERTGGRGLLNENGQVRIPQQTRQLVTARVPSPYSSSDSQPRSKWKAGDERAITQFQGHLERSKSRLALGSSQSEAPKYYWVRTPSLPFLLRLPSTEQERAWPWAKTGEGTKIPYYRVRTLLSSVVSS